MKRIGILLFVCSFLLSIPTHILAKDNIPLTGTWADIDLRSLKPAPPQVDLEGNVLTITLPSPLANLNVVITDSEGNIVYQDSLSTLTPGAIFDVILPDVPESYQITFSHLRWGKLGGVFEIE